ncbi:synaptic vesicle glycoprotein 2C-like [Condylostylus longicornis]|uniref:synaptic vesicle glycoprotein 2C-like n=1 Tax=Condylostylus longicornis TaxID=2530218 RepID=UPI00244DA54D|nr:synaptic vesicle glycoprotein 2C-like [Condylostylus longicornis]XP_055390141.1 synaptic vesicle glycoprotein 2C-like [Condylostylus longicornis]
MTIPVKQINDAELPTQTSSSINFEDVLAETKLGKFNYVVIIVSGLVLATTLIETLGISYVLPVSNCDIMLTTTEKGLIKSIGFIGIIISSHFWGFLADTSGRRKIMAPALFSAFIFAVISSFCTNFWMLIIFRFFTCFFISAGSATIYAYVGEFHCNKLRSKAIMAASTLFGIGATCLPLLPWLILNEKWSIEIDAINITYKPWRLLIIIYAIPDLICSILLWILPESPKFLLSIGKKEETLSVLRTMYSFNTGKSKHDFPVNTLERCFEKNHTIKKLPPSLNPVIKLLKIIQSQTTPLFSIKYLKSTLLASTMQFIIFFTMQGLYVWYPYILNTLNEFEKINPNNSSLICEIMSFKENKIIFNGYQKDSEIKCQEDFEIKTYITSLILEIFYVVGFTVIGFSINIIGKTYILLIILSICGISGLLCNFITSPTISGYFYTILLAGGITVPVVNAATVDLYPTNLRAMAVSISLMFGRLGSVAGSNMVGFLLNVNCRMVFYISGCSLLIAAFFGFFIPKPKENIVI